VKLVTTHVHTEVAPDVTFRVLARLAGNTCVGCEHEHLVAMGSPAVDHILAGKLISTVVVGWIHIGDNEDPHRERRLR
jgi:hypothetical protein